MKKSDSACRAIRAANTEAQVVAAVREYLASLGPEEVAALPAQVMAFGLHQVEEVVHSALDLVHREMLAMREGPESEVLAEVTLVFSTAAKRLPPSPRTRRRGALHGLATEPPRETRAPRRDERQRLGGSMARDGEKRKFRDPERLDLSDPEEVAEWTRVRGVSEEELARAVAAAGNTLLNLREHFNLRR
jgi:Protein of unknown function (DUF3606).